MKILFLGEYSNVHATLAEGLRALGHKVCVASNGDFWKNYPRDIDLSRIPTKWGGVKFMARLYAMLPRFSGYDIVQIINPMFLECKAERIGKIYRYLRSHNKRVVMGAYGMDYYWVNECITRKPLRYSDFNIGNKLRTNADALKERQDWLGTSKERLNRMIAEDCDAIVAGLYEYMACYAHNFPEKTAFIPLPIKVSPDEALTKCDLSVHRKVRVFIGINRSRSEYKGTDIMLRAAQAVAHDYPECISLQIAENVPFAEYVKMMQGADAIIDQLYSYTPSMNPLEAMAHGIICIGGGEPENYEIINETQLRPIINVQPDYDSCYEEIKQLVLHPERIPQLKRDSIEYVRKHHDHIKVAKEYEKLYTKTLDTVF